MAEKSYSGKILKTYFWQFLSNALRICSMFIVAPFLTKNPSDYGIYMVCMSILVFLSFTDFGFFGAAAKFVSEFVGKGDSENEKRVLGFALFVNSLFIALYFSIFILFALHPEIIIKGLNDISAIKTASTLFWILIFWGPFKILEKICTIILDARVSIYVMRRIYLVSSAITITSVVVFFSKSQYNIIGYMIFSASMDIVALVFTILAIRKKFEYDFIGILKNVRFNKETYKVTRSLAFASIYTSVVWVLFNNFDLVFLSKRFGPQVVSLYAVAISCATFIETFIGSSGISGPYLARFNHFMGNKDIDGLRSYYVRIVVILLPLICFPVIALIGIMKPFILSWVGVNYQQSILFTSILLSSYLLHFITMPSNYVTIARKKPLYIAASATVMLIIYWSGVLLFLSVVGIKIMPIMKCISYLFSGVLEIYLAWRALRFSIKEIITKVGIAFCLAMTGLMYAGYTLSILLPKTKGKIELASVLATYACLVFSAGALYSLLSPYMKKEVLFIITPVIKKIQNKLKPKFEFNS
jgi:O-antigen/teichoic acid export membrane protein